MPHNGFIYPYGQDIPEGEYLRPEKAGFSMEPRSSIINHDRGIRCLVFEECARGRPYCATARKEYTLNCLFFECNYKPIDPDFLPSLENAAGAEELEEDNGSAWIMILLVTLAALSLIHI